MRPRSLLPAFILGLIAFLAYRFTAAPGVLMGDAGEFQFTTTLAGVSHPTGYPLYHLLGWVWGWLYRSNPAQGANHFSALWAGLAVALFYLLAYEALSRLLARLNWRSGTAFLAVLTTLVFAANPAFWAQATQAEVYTMNAALVAGLLGATLAVGRLGAGGEGRRRGFGPVAWPVALLFGLGLAHHLTVVVFAPAILFYLYLFRPEALKPGNFVRLLPFVLAPLLLYAFVPLRAPASPWLRVELAPGQVLDLFDSSAAGVARFVLGTNFAPELRGPAEALAQAPFAANQFLVHFGWVGLTLALLGLAAMVLEEQLDILVLTGVSFVLVVVFNLFYGIQDIAAYFIPAYLIVTLWLGLGLAYVVEMIGRITSPALRPYLLALALAILALPYLLFQSHRPQFDRSGDLAAFWRWQTILRQDLPDNAVLVSNDRDEITPMLYLKYVESEMPDMTGLFPLVGTGAEWRDLNTTLEAATATGRPVIGIKPMPGIEARYRVRHLPSDLVEVLGPQEAPNPSYEAPYGDYLRWLGINWSEETQPGGVLDVNLFWRVTETPPAPWHSFLQLVDASGTKVAQADDHRPGGDYLPAPLWRPGDVVADHFALGVPADLPPGDYALAAGFYDPVTGERMAEPLIVAAVRFR